ncbi:toprim domain-containing protein [Myroides odoratimimus]|uniref:CHC2 zinc finger domain-containing protein n=1 Tax=Myroides odoratimimus TaxID=76832 RepID=UPI002574990D|nr:toprim domain-containing protein [Myroides odoratimimus]MDM1415776.1 toprim domain-containing protein [Myroides odoratimimus]MDM1448391.1 toprim domain-containing protein [Myroides odoratimimus]MEC4009287.1 toprim domain-containing protein [Myroides odoratimimus]
MNCDTAKQIRIIDLLEKLGYSPKRIANESWWYISPFRQEKTPSFKVNLAKNLYYDFGEGTGGTTLDFVMRYNNCDIKSALSILDNNVFSFVQPTVLNTTSQSENNYEIISIKEVTNTYLIQYAKSRKLCLRMLKKYCKEIHYTLNDKSYYAIGFKNDKNGYELRNKYVKMCLGSKAVSYICNNSKKVILLESWSDFISFLTLYPNTEYQFDYIILNSVTTLNSKLLSESNTYLYKSNKIKYESIICLFDNDKAGDIATEKVLDTYRNITVDERVAYQEYKDLNDYLLTINPDNSV